MMNRKEIELYAKVREEIQADPNLTDVVIRALTDGLKQAAIQARKDQSDWETIALNAMEDRLFSDNRNWLAGQIEKIKDRACFRWDHIIERMKK